MCVSACASECICVYVSFLALVALAAAEPGRVQRRLSTEFCPRIMVLNQIMFRVVTAVPCTWVSRGGEGKSKRKEQRIKAV